MKVEVEIPKVSSSTNFKSEQYSIGDEARILDIMRNKLYSNSQRSICQEIMSNAKDANAESGMCDTPIRVTFPTELDMCYIVSDNGIGISPDRISNVFVRYGVSTKRDSNDSIGAFGIGAKVPFSYSDQFTVITTSAHAHFEKGGENFENCNVKRTYLNYIDETRMGKISLLNEEVTADCTGTSIVIPVKPKDEDVFADYTQAVGRFWDVRPEIVNPSEDFEWEEFDFVITGKDEDWAIFSDTGERSTIVLGGIPYRLDMPTMRKLVTSAKQTEIVDNLHSSSTPICLFFKIGDLPVTANRESIDYTEKSVARIMSVIERLNSEVVTKAQEEVDDAASYMEAHHIFAKMPKFTNIKVKDLTWQGHALHACGNGILTEYTHSVRIYSFTNNGGYAPKRQKEATIPLMEDTQQILEDDCETTVPQNSRIQDAFNKNDDIDVIYTFRFLDDDDGKRRKKIGEDFLNLFDFERVCKYDKIKLLSNRSKSATKEIVRAKKAKSDGSVWGHPNPVDIDKKNGGGIYFESSRNCAIMTIFGKEIELEKYNTSSVLKYVSSKTIYSIPKRFAKKMGKKWKKLDKVIEEIITNIIKDKNYLLCDALSRNCPDINKDLLKQKSLVRDRNSVFMKIANLIDKGRASTVKMNKIAEVKSIAEICGVANKLPKNDGKIEKEIVELQSSFNRTYPLVDAISYYGFSQSNVKDLLIYINAKNSFMRKNKKSS